MSELLTVAEAAAYLRLAPGIVYQKVARKELPALRVGGRGKILFRRCDIDAVLRPTMNAVRVKTPDLAFLGRHLHKPLHEFSVDAVASALR
jgi:excisionase family DNA binding protein